MMKVKQTKPFTFEAGKRAVLLLHGFTGNSADVRMLGRFLEKKAIRAMHRIIKDMAFHRKSLSRPDLRIGGKMS